MPTERSTSVVPAPSRPHMPGYGLAEGPDGLLPWSWAEERLEESHNYWLATVRPDGRPHLMIVWGLWYGGVFYFSTGSDSRKARNLESNAHCVIGSEQALLGEWMHRGRRREAPRRGALEIRYLRTRSARRPV